MMFKIITLFVGLYVRVGILFIRVCSDIMFSVGYCIVCPLFYGLRLPPWYIHIFLCTNQVN